MFQCELITDPGTLSIVSRLIVLVHFLCVYQLSDVSVELFWAVLLSQTETETKW